MSVSSKVSGGEKWEWDTHRTQSSKKDLTKTEKSTNSNVFLLHKTKSKKDGGAGKKVLVGSVIRNWDGTWRAIKGYDADSWEVLLPSAEQSAAMRAVEIAVEAPGTTPAPESPYIRRDKRQPKLPLGD